MDKRRIKSVLYGFEVRSTAAIVNGLVHHTPKQVVLNQIRRELRLVSTRISLNNLENHYLWLDLYDRYVKVSKKTFSALKKSNDNYKDDLENRQNVVYEVIRGELARLEKTKNEVADIHEHRAKHDSLRNLLGSGVFYLCSEHKNPAKDHAKYQGKIYVSEDWKSRCDDSDRARIEAYIKNKGIMTVESVVWQSPWLCTRKNCKHYLIEVPTDEVLSASAKSLVKRHKLLVDNKIPLSDAKRSYLAYYERLKVLVELNRMCKSSKLTEDIRRTRKLVRKWAVRARTEQ